MSYVALSGVYDTLTFNVEYKKRASYIRSLLVKNGCESGILLDMACGTGTLSKELGAFGYDMILTDISPEMLNFARERNPEALVLCQSMTALDLFGTINGAVCSLDSVNHLLKPCDVKKTFQNVSLFTEHGGVFVFDVNTEYKHEHILGNHTFVYEKDDVYCVWQNSYKAKSKTVDINLDIFTRNGNVYTKESESFSERAYPVEKITEWLEEAGFAVQGIYDDMTFEPPRADSQRLYFAAVKL